MILLCQAVQNRTECRPLKPYEAGLDQTGLDSPQGCACDSTGIVGNHEMDADRYSKMLALHTLGCAEKHPFLDSAIPITRWKQTWCQSNAKEISFLSA